MPNTKQPSAVVIARRESRKAERAARAKQQDAAKPVRQPIDPAKSYTRESLKAETGIGFVWFREAVKNGLPVHPAGRFKFVSGKDLIDFIHSDKGKAISAKVKEPAADV